MSKLKKMVKKEFKKLSKKEQKRLNNLNRIPISRPGYRFDQKNKPRKKRWDPDEE